MEETPAAATTTAKKPLSLNQRYTNFLSASHSKPPTREENQSKLNELKYDAPQFSINDFDSSPEAKIGTARESVVYEDEEEIDDSVAHDSGFADVEPLPEKSKPEKVKIKGRRRLCKVASTDDEEQIKEENHNLFDISDFSSPPPVKDVSCGGDEIRDILNDLSSKMGFLSIEKKRNPRPVDLKAVPLEDVSLKKEEEKGAGQKDELEDSEFGSVDSSFANGSDLSSSSLSVTGGVEDNEVESGLSEPDGCNFAEEPKQNKNAYKGKSKNVSRAVEETEKNKNAYKGKSQNVSRMVEETKKNENVYKGKSKNVSRTVEEKPVVSQRSSFYDYKDEGDSDEDDCVEVGGNNWTRRAKGHDALGDEDDAFVDEEYGDSSVVEVLDDDTRETVSGDEFAINLSGPRSTYKLSSKIGKMLYPHQREGLRWLWSLHCQEKGGILGDDMGLGKTMQIAGFLAGLFSSRLIKRAMIVAPKTLLPHWIKELSAVGLSKRIKEYFGTCPKLRQYELEYVLQDKGILLTTYDIVRFNAKQLCGSDYYDEDDDIPLWDYMILDEGHLIKNPSTQRAKSLLGIPCAHRIIISGTPIQNNLKELWALFSFCCPDLLGDHREFRDRYEHPILRGNDKKASDRERHVGSKVAKELRERIQPYFLRRMKSEVFRDDDTSESKKLSKKNEIIVWLRLTSCQRQLYEAFLKSEIVLSAFDGSPLAAITILKKICDHPYLLTKRAAEDVLEGMDSMLNQEDCGLAEKLAMHAAQLTEENDLQEKHANLSCKISFILSLLEKLIPEGHNVLIFSQTRKMLNIIQESLLTNGFEFLRIDGTTKASDRLKIVNEFQEGRGAPIFLLTSQVGGLGLTLTNADRVIVVDPAWNPSMDNQSVDRAYRIGQKKDVLVYRLMTCATIEEKIYRMQIFKGGLFKTATEQKEQTRYFSQQDLKELFSLPKDGFDVSPTQLQLVAEHGDQVAMSDFLRTHINFLESLGIGGVSHHSLLYTKSEPAPAVVQVEEDEPRRMGTKIYKKYGSSSTSTEHYVAGAQYAFNPKDVNLNKTNVSPQYTTKMTESDIKERINRLSQLLSDKGLRLPDRGERLRKQISELNTELVNLTTPEKTNQVIDLDDITDALQRSSLHV
ncbi:protein CHROMATIN REMODELING 24 isoform X2 [Spinacia oleracea]|uniref:Protein CHROMATIN REMODELING 24 isoform X2 n=1 Tax=Spinacia oleracea TaxID=3562 RepID=A0A9R0J5Z0_SPIOL|nr:protein CHROMATIN REMODELING 24 isoform X2 [Spinacia oleracea]